MSKHPTEKDRVGKVVENCIGGREGTIGYAILRERVVRAILKEIKRAERREREACAKIVDDAKYDPHCECDTYCECSSGLISGYVTASAIRNRRKV